jgi:predicted dehydrogenase
VAEKIVKVGIAGQGRSGFDIHARWLREVPEQFEIVAVADQIPARRKQARDELDAKAYKDYKELLKAGGFDLFVNALPSNLHPKGTLEALRAGYNVVCEKPLATKVADFDKMTTEAGKARKLFAPFQNSRFYPFFQKTLEVIDSGVLGEIIECRLNWSGFARRWDWQTKQELWGGNLNNTGPHPMDHAVMLFGNRTPNVFAKQISGPGSFGDADDFDLIILHGRNAPTVEVKISSYQAYPQGAKLYVNGAYGGLEADVGYVKWKYYDPNKAPKQRLHTGWSEDRGFCREKLAWVEKEWSRERGGEFRLLSQCFYNNIHDVLVNNAKLIVQASQVRRQVHVLEQARKQNRLPKRKTAGKAAARAKK